MIKQKQSLSALTLKKRKQKSTLDHVNASSYLQVAGIHLFTCAFVLTEAVTQIPLLTSLISKANFFDFSKLAANDIYPKIPSSFQSRYQFSLMPVAV